MQIEKLSGKGLDQLFESVLSLKRFRRMLSIF